MKKLLSLLLLLNLLACTEEVEPANEAPFLGNFRINNSLGINIIETYQAYILSFVSEDESNLDRYTLSISNPDAGESYQILDQEIRGKNISIMDTFEITGKSIAGGLNCSIELTVYDRQGLSRSLSQEVTLLKKGPTIQALTNKGTYNPGDDLNFVGQLRDNINLVGMHFFLYREGANNSLDTIASLQRSFPDSNDRVYNLTAQDYLQIDGQLPNDSYRLRYLVWDGDNNLSLKDEELVINF